MLASRYKTVQASTASQERTMVLLFEAALRHLRLGRAAIGKNPGASIAAFDRASEIVLELQRALKPELAPALCEQLHDIYGFVVGRLGLAATHQEGRHADEAERAFAPIVEAFVQACAAAPAATPSGPTVRP